MQLPPDTSAHTYSSRRDCPVFRRLAAHATRQSCDCGKGLNGDSSASINLGSSGGLVLCSACWCRSQLCEWDSQHRSHLQLHFCILIECSWCMESILLFSKGTALGARWAPPHIGQVPVMKSKTCGLLGR